MAKLITPPAPKPIESDIELFAKAYFNIHLTTAQIGILQGVINGIRIRSNFPKKIGVSTVEKVLKAYLTEGSKPGGRVRLPQHYLPPRGPKMKGVSQEGKILAMIQRPTGAYNFELSRVALKYTSVISALRKDGHDIVADRQYLKNGRASNTWKYRIGGH